MVDNYFKVGRDRFFFFDSHVDTSVRDARNKALDAEIKLNRRACVFRRCAGAQSFNEVGEMTVASPAERDLAS
jgi:hypothetical protein